MITLNHFLADYLIDKCKELIYEKLEFLNKIGILKLKINSKSLFLHALNVIFFVDVDLILVIPIVNFRKNRLKYGIYLFCIPVPGTT
ncbi:hypothetical protein BpHYR1_011155 [Brachionus plicatilis]|uniref:Uncharacterized protein n=1 Tax=Brachionus plicatilis TaxID=10195 RepID=A0A3M7T3D9_BRAPC|nr:hypothetical protein BpHYR1_011155 [Brachionus plicatilis]